MEDPNDLQFFHDLLKLALLLLGVVDMLHKIKEWFRQRKSARPNLR